MKDKIIFQVIPNGASASGGPPAPGAPPIINVQSDQKPTMPSPHIPKQTTNVLSASSGLSGAASVSGGALATSVGAISSNPFSLNAGSGRSLDLSINTVPGKEFIVYPSPLLLFFGFESVQ